MLMTTGGKTMNLPPEQMAIHRTIMAINVLIEMMGLSRKTEVSFLGKGVITVVGELALKEIITSDPSAMACINHPDMPDGFTLVINFMSPQRYEIHLGTVHYHDEDSTTDSGADYLIEAVDRLLEGTYIDFHADGRITGTGIGHHIARTLRKSIEGDELHHLLNHKDVKKPMRLQLSAALWDWLPGIEPDVTRH